MFRSLTDIVHPVAAIGPASMPDQSTAGQRNGAIEALRVLGAFGIILFHTGAPGGSIGYAALPAFILLSLMFQMDRGGPFDIRSRVHRLLVPFAAWSGIYATALIVQAVAQNDMPLGWIRPWMIFTGPALHLWFLPFLAAGTAVLIRYREAISVISFVGLFVATALLAAVCFWLLHHNEPMTGLAQWVFGAPAVLFAVLIVRANTGARMAAVAVFSAVLLTLADYGWTNGPLQLGLAVIAVLMVRRFATSTPVYLGYLARLTLGIYLIHPLLAAVLVRLPMPWSEGSLGFACLLFGVSAISVVAMRLSPLGQKIT